MINPATGLLILPAATALILAVLPGYRASAWVNVLGGFATLISALLLLVWQPTGLGTLLQVDDLSITFLILNNLVGFTTAIFSRTYISHEITLGRLKRQHLRFYHALYQVLLGAMNLAL